MTNLKDKLSHPTFREACKLLGPEGGRLIREGGKYEIDNAEQVTWGEELFRVNLDDAIVTFSLTSEKPKSLRFECSECARRRLIVMKKRIIRGYILLLVLVLGCATVPIKPITQDDISDLKGKRKEFYRDRYNPAYVQPIELEIWNFEGFNVYGRTIWSHANRPALSTPFIGKTENGRLIGGYLNLTLPKGAGKMKLEGEYRIETWEGTVSMNKIN